MDGIKEGGTPVSQSIVANIQLGLPATVSKLSSKMRFIDRIAPALKESGVIRNIELINPLTIKASGIAATNRTANAFGGILYIAGAVRQDILIQEGSIYKTRQESTVDVDEIDDLDSHKKLKFIDIINVYRLFEDLMEDDEKPELVLVDVPLLLERQDVPLSDRKDLQKVYKECVDKIEGFWEKYKDKIYPFNDNGIKIASVGNKRFGAVIFALTQDKVKYVVDDIDRNIIVNMNSILPKLQEVGIKRLLTGILVKRTRTAAYEINRINDEERNRLEPQSVGKYEMIGMHIKAGNTTPPTLVEVLGSKELWTTEMLDELASQIISLIAFDQQKAMPLPLWYAKYALNPLEATNNGKNAILQYYKTQAREMLKNEELENIWKEDLDVFEE
ncbi:hypothetical protein Desca_0290 [Desulfotomaculum nigrificans CO-1-SRB]|uniref:NurA domain-containing protein n=1 Tax=Desulfotomaculum nigrificans (strain DSM 14880 / VKM B-2319 / CO-1-SRB) TaxID=868595 RepID=F6B6C3_DESCC|nr:hypothetical protein [Desulfotomaculum nigrificans]AEF93194.1 hypothetical protein Desca_0290 [Desulfotomaculum nigrificans CO-1-SRB]